jgi:methylmalonyl-CoA mutase cobalamin-binding domain/chain
MSATEGLQLHGWAPGASGRGRRPALPAVGSAIDASIVGWSRSPIATMAAGSELGRPDIMIVVGGVIPPADVLTLRETGAAAVFGPGTVIAEAATELLATLSTELFG